MPRRGGRTYLVTFSGPFNAKVAVGRNTRSSAEKWAWVELRERWASERGLSDPFRSLDWAITGIEFVGTTQGG